MYYLSITFFDAVIEERKKMTTNEILQFKSSKDKTFPITFLRIFFIKKNSFVMFKTNTEKQIFKHHNGFPRKRKEGDK